MRIDTLKSTEAASGLTSPALPASFRGGSTQTHPRTRLAIRFEDRIKRFLPAGFYYPRKIAKEAKKHEPELGVLNNLVPAGRAAIDIGANRGYYSYALSKLASRVEAFEPNPVLASFAAKKLEPKVRVHEVALSHCEGRGVLYIPRTERGVSLHLLASLHRVHPSYCWDEIEVSLATLDSYRYRDVGFIKIDAEGSEMDIVDGARETILRCRPVMLIELLAGTHSDPLAHITEIQQRFRYEARLLANGVSVDASLAVETGVRLSTRNVLFIPR